MENLLITMIIGTAIFTCAAIALGIYGWRLNKKFPHVVKAKVLRIEPMENGKHRYHFECKNNGRYIATDTITYKKKKFKVGEKTTVRLGANCDVCHSDFPIWPIAASILCLILALILPLVYFADKRNEERAKEAEGSLYQETGYYIVTDTDTFLCGDNLGLIMLNRSENYISTGDYGGVFFLGTPKYDDGSIIPTIQSLGSNISTDGVPDDVPSDVMKQVEKLGYKIKLEVTDSASLIELESDHDHDHNHDHDESEETVHNEMEIDGNFQRAEDATTSPAEQ